VAKRLSIILIEQVQIATHQVQALSLQHGISSLPDDALLSVLMYATRPDDWEDGVPVAVDVEVEMKSIRAALSLSHVCSMFRLLVQNSPRIWNILSDRFPNTDMALHYTRYSKSAPLDVLLQCLGFHIKDPNSGICCRP